MRQYALPAAVLLALAGLVFSGSGGSLTDAEKQCIRGCCENAGGVYDYEHNGCESPESDITDCADACREQESGFCPFAALLAAGLAGFLLARSKEQGNKMVIR